MSDPLIGIVVDGKFEVRGVLGEGAMGRVYRARQVNLDKPVALKVLHKNLASDPLLVKRFHREARAASKLAHPNSLAVIDFGGDKDGTLYIAMELLEGEDLGTVLQRETILSKDRIIDILSQVCLALEEAHQAGIVHRDLKPENIFLQHVRGRADFVKVCDFGIAKIAEEEGGQSKVTMAGFVCGTPEYMSPEQARGDALDHRADVYSIGIILYEMLTGQVPFRAESALGVVTRHLTETPKPPREVRTDIEIPAALERICMKAIAKKREERFASAEQLRRALESAAHDAAVAGRESAAALPAPSIPKTSVSPWMIVSIVLFLAGASVAAWWIATRAPSDDTTRVTRAGSDPPPPTKASGTRATDPFALVTPEGTTAQSPVRPDPPLAAADAGAAAQAPTPDVPLGIDPPEATPTPPAAVDPSTMTPAERRAAEREERRQREEEERRRAERDRVRLEREQQERQGGETRPATPATPGTPGTPTQSPGEAALTEARELRSRGQYAQAASRLEDAARLMPGNAGVQRQLGQLYTRMGQVERGRAAYRRYLRLAPNARDAPAIRGILGEPEPSPPAPN